MTKKDIGTLKLTTTILPYAGFAIKLKHMRAKSWLWRNVKDKTNIIEENNWWFDAWSTLK